MRPVSVREPFPDLSTVSVAFAAVTMNRALSLLSLPAEDGAGAMAMAGAKAWRGAMAGVIASPAQT